MSANNLALVESPSERSFITESKDILSANHLALVKNSSERSFIKTENNNGPKKNTPAVLFIHVET